MVEAKPSQFLLRSEANVGFWRVLVSLVRPRGPAKVREKEPMGTLNGRFFFLLSSSRCGTRREFLLAAEHALEALCVGIGHHTARGCVHARHGSTRVFAGVVAVVAVVVERERNATTYANDDEASLSCRARRNAGG